MKENSLKNMIVLKNLPSNIVEEAIVILKNGTKIKKLEKVEKNKLLENRDNKTKDKEYILKEAEMLINTYILNIEKKKDCSIIGNRKINKKYKKLKKYSYIATIIIFIQALMLLIK